jgi:hypothetical protein
VFNYFFSTVEKEWENATFVENTSQKTIYLRIEDYILEKNHTHATTAEKLLVEEQI